MWREFYAVLYFLGDLLCLPGFKDSFLVLHHKRQVRQLLGHAHAHMSSTASDVHHLGAATQGLEREDVFSRRPYNFRPRHAKGEPLPTNDIFGTEIVKKALLGLKRGLVSELAYVQLVELPDN